MLERRTRSGLLRAKTEGMRLATKREKRIRLKRFCEGAMKRRIVGGGRTLKGLRGTIKSETAYDVASASSKKLCLLESLCKDKVLFCALGK